MCAFDVKRDGKVHLMYPSYPQSHKATAGCSIYMYIYISTVLFSQVSKSQIQASILEILEEIKLPELGKKKIYNIYFPYICFQYQTITFISLDKVKLFQEMWFLFEWWFTCLNGQVW